MRDINKNQIHKADLVFRGRMAKTGFGFQKWLDDINIIKAKNKVA